MGTSQKFVVIIMKIRSPRAFAFCVVTVNEEHAKHSFPIHVSVKSMIINMTYTCTENYLPS